MTPERLDELALEVAKHLDVKLDNACGCSKCRERDDPPVLKAYARALLAAVEAELKPVLWQWRREPEPFQLAHTFELEVFATTVNSEVRKLIPLPLIKEKP